MRVFRTVLKVQGNLVMLSGHGPGRNFSDKGMKNIVFLIKNRNLYFQEFSESVYPSIKEVLRLGGPYPQTIRSGFGDYWYAGFHDQECFSTKFSVF